MPRIKHCGQYRRTQNFVLNSNDPAYAFQILLSATCSKCEQHVLEYVGVLPGFRMAGQYRIKEKDHKTWIERTNLDTGDLAKGYDTSQWGVKRAAVYWVTSSQHEWPYAPIKVRVQ